MKYACTYQHCLGSNTEGAETVLHYLLYMGTTQDSRLRGRGPRGRASTMTGAGRGWAGGERAADADGRTEAEEMTTLGLARSLGAALF